MKPKLWTALAVFLGSYLPLGTILLVQDVDPACCTPGHILCLKHPVWSIPPVVLTLICFISTASLLAKIPTKRPLNIIEAKYIPSEMINYTFPYIVSFISFNYDDGPKIAGFLIFLAVLFVLTYRAGRLFVNPLLIVIGWRAYEITYSFAGDTGERKGFALAQSPDLSIGSVEGAQIEDLLLIRRPAGV